VLFVSLTRPGITIAVTAILTVVLGIAASRIEVDNTPENWLPSDTSGLDELAQFRERFGDDSIILAVSRNADLGSAAWRADFAALAETIRGIEGVGSVLAPARAVPAPTDDPYEAALAEGAAAIRPPIEPYLVGADGRHVALAISVGGGLDPPTRSRLVTRLEDALAAAPSRLGSLDIAGADVITHDLDHGTARSLASLGPLVLLLMCAVFYGSTRSVRAVGAMILTTVAAATASVGLMALAGRRLNLVVAAMPAILAVTTVAYATHLLSHYLGIPAAPGEARDHGTRLRWWQEALETTWRPSLLTALTTAAGFAALVTSGIPPIRDMGIFTAIGVLSSFVFAFTFLPALLSLSDRVAPHAVASRHWTAARAVAVTHFLRRHAWTCIAVAVFLALLGVLGMTDLRVESHVLRFFPEDHRVPRNYREIEATLVGLTPFELVVEGPRARMLTPAAVGALDEYLQAALRDEPLLLQVISPLEAVAPGTSAERRAHVLDTVLPRRPDLLPDAVRRFVWMSDDGDTLALRTTLTSRTGTSNEVHALIERLRARLDGRVPDGLRAHITGGPTLLIRGQVLLVDTQVQSFALSFLVVTAIIALNFRSVSIVVVSLIPNLLPLVYTLGLMGLTGIPLDAATVTVAGIALGLLVDDTIHLLHHYTAAQRIGMPAVTAVADSLFAVGRPVLVTCVAVAAGFGAFALSPFPPTRYFGLLIAWTAMMAVVCDLVLLPALLLVRTRGPAAGPSRRWA